MRRLPIYFLIDVSESMVGEPIDIVQDGMANIVKEQRTDPYALETVYISIIAFAGKAKTIAPLTELSNFYPPKLPIGGGTSLGSALNFIRLEIDNSVQKTTEDEKLSQTCPWCGQTANYSLGSSDIKVTQTKG